MSYDSEKNHVSVGSWMWMMFVTGIPIIGLIMVIVWAFSGDNESRKNYFRAILMWLLLAIGLVVALVVVGKWPEIMRQIQTRIQKT